MRGSLPVGVTSNQLPIQVRVVFTHRLTADIHACELEREAPRGVVVFIKENFPEVSCLHRAGEVWRGGWSCQTLATTAHFSNQRTRSMLYHDVEPASMLGCRLLEVWAFGDCGHCVWCLAAGRPVLGGGLAWMENRILCLSVCLRNKDRRGVRQSIKVFPHFAAMKKVTFCTVYWMSWQNLWTLASLSMWGLK